MSSAIDRMREMVAETRLARPLPGWLYWRVSPDVAAAIPLELALDEALARLGVDRPDDWIYDGALGLLLVVDGELPPNAIILDHRPSAAHLAKLVEWNARGR